ncbi:hypothetical protein [Pseudanabaena sp. FACHB-2040]|uniref:hypothetical protein n=1 Tax=Pseudanabaena sp. FACHB-2040 TaxID=2692859 RepID=UPI00168593EF|nr:hypothetical protein [Pseudanabaena sp. FACHB-2040]MBD2258729.1 hypothetical protein [Pseudanabaena sp. FACHB-2040]
MRIGSSHVYRPSEIVPLSGKYDVLTTSGSRTGETVYCVKDGRFPVVDPPAYGFLLTQQDPPR